MSIEMSWVNSISEDKCNIFKPQRTSSSSGCSQSHMIIMCEHYIRHENNKNVYDTFSQNVLHYSMKMHSLSASPPQVCLRVSVFTQIDRKQEVTYKILFIYVNCRKIYEWTRWNQMNRRILVGRYISQVVSYVCIHSTSYHYIKILFMVKRLENFARVRKTIKQMILLRPGAWERKEKTQLFVLHQKLALKEFADFLIIVRKPLTLHSATQYKIHNSVDKWKEWSDKKESESRDKMAIEEGTQLRLNNRKTTTAKMQCVKSRKIHSNCDQLTCWLAQIHSNSSHCMLWTRRVLFCYWIIFTRMRHINIPMTTFCFWCGTHFTIAKTLSSRLLLIAKPNQWNWCMKKDEDDNDENEKKDRANSMIEKAERVSAYDKNSSKWKWKQTTFSPIFARLHT